MSPNRPRNESSIVSMSGIPVTAVEYAYCIIIVGSKIPKETNETDFVIYLPLSSADTQDNKTRCSTFNSGRLDIIALACLLA